MCVSCLTTRELFACEPLPSLSLQSVSHFLQILTVTHALYVSGMAHLHNVGILHCDLKSDNILLFGPRLSPKIADFGLSRLIDWEQRPADFDPGTPEYLAPEVFFSRYHTRQGDVYQFGIMLWEMVYAQTPYDHLPQVTHAERECEQIQERQV